MWKLVFENIHIVLIHVIHAFLGAWEQKIEYLNKMLLFFNFEKQCSFFILPA